MKKPYLATYDFGTGGVWLYVLAASRAAISEKFPELVIVDEVPSWMPDDLHERLFRTPEDIANPGVKLAAIATERKKRP